jgi:hypothetical protein
MKRTIEDIQYDLAIEHYCYGISSRYRELEILLEQEIENESRSVQKETKEAETVQGD